MHSPRGTHLARGKGALKEVALMPLHTEANAPICERSERTRADMPTSRTVPRGRTWARRPDGRERVGHTGSTLDLAHRHRTTQTPSRALPASGGSAPDIDVSSRRVLAVDCLTGTDMTSARTRVGSRSADIRDRPPALVRPGPVAIFELAALLFHGPQQCDECAEAMAGGSAALAPLTRASRSSPSGGVPARRLPGEVARAGQRWLS